MAISFTAATTHTKTLTNPSTGSEDKVYGVDYVSASSHTTSVAVAGATAARIPYASSATELTDSANLTYSETSGPRLQVGSGSGTSAGWILGYFGTSGQSGLWPSSVTPSGTNYALYADSGITYLNSTSGTRFAVANVDKMTFSATAGRGAYITAGTATTDVNALSATQTWNAAGVAFTFADWTITDTTSAPGSLAFRIRGGAAGTTALFSVDKAGTTTAFAFTSSGGASITSSGNALAASAAYFGNTGRCLFLSPSTTSLCAVDSSATAPPSFTLGLSGGARAITYLTKSVTAFTDAVAKTVFTLTIPNAAHSASYLVRLTGSIGAGGAIGANEASATNCYVVTICRTAGVNAVATISAAFGAAASNVAGATTVTCTGALAAVSGGVSAVNTIDIQATITKAGGASDNHTCVATASLLNANASGITIS